ncbi:MAG: putative sugar nucleotidyl transferase [Planctomycetota bacterium]
MRICIYEDLADRFYPVALTRPVFELVCGHESLRAKLERRLVGNSFCYSVRDSLAALYREQNPGAAVNDSLASPKEDILFLNGRLLASSFIPPADGPEEVGKSGSDIVYVRAKPASIAAAPGATATEKVASLAAKLPSKEIKATVIGWIWELIHHNPAEITRDFEIKGHSGVEGKLEEFVAILGDRKNVFIAPGARVHPMVVIDAQNGPVYVAENVEILPHTRVEGPCYLGPKTILYGGKIREGSSLGPVCRVGGEVEESIIHGCSNKYHDGFLGHSYVGMWVNLGALTTNSDLKNDYGTVDVHMTGKLVDTGDTKIGSFIGDHTKTSIGTLLNTGTYLGMMCNILASGEPAPKFIPDFVWHVRGKFMRARMKDALATARTAMGRRKKELSPAEEAVLQHAFQLTEEERNEEIKKSRAKV